jgi:hypothetical protein
MLETCCGPCRLFIHDMFAYRLHLGLIFQPRNISRFVPSYLQGEFRAIGWGVDSWVWGLVKVHAEPMRYPRSTRVLVPIATSDSLVDIGITINESVLRISGGQKPGSLGKDG